VNHDPVREDHERWVELGWDQPDGMTAFMSVLRAHKLLVDRAHEALNPIGLSITDHACLLFLAMSEGQQAPMSRVADRLLIGAGRCNYVINNLESRGLVRKERHPSDGRTTLAVLTDLGLECAIAGNKTMAEFRYGFADLSPDELVHLTDCLSMILQTDHAEHR
jgi:DNA-binding MarR family transcriptional regulator